MQSIAVSLTLIETFQQNQRISGYNVATEILRTLGEKDDLTWGLAQCYDVGRRGQGSLQQVSTSRYKSARHSKKNKTTAYFSRAANDAAMQH